MWSRQNCLVIVTSSGIDCDVIGRTKTEPARHANDGERYFSSFMDYLYRVRNEIMYELSWQIVSALTRVLFWFLFPSLLRNSGTPQWFSRDRWNSSSLEYIHFSLCLVLTGDCWLSSTQFEIPHSIIGIYYNHFHFYLCAMRSLNLDFSRITFCVVKLISYTRRQHHLIVPNTCEVVPLNWNISQLYIGSLCSLTEYS